LVAGVSYKGKSIPVGGYLLQNKLARFACLFQRFVSMFGLTVYVVVSTISLVPRSLVQQLL